MSRAEGRSLPAPPRIAGVLRIAAEDLYYHGVRLVTVNVIWGIGLLVTVAAFSVSPLLGIAPLVAMVPLTVGLMGMVTAVVRERTVVMSDLTRAIRARLWPQLALGVAQLALVAIAGVDFWIGSRLGGILGVILMVGAFYTVLAMWVTAVASWPILTDPLRRDLPTPSCVRLGLLLVIAHPLRLGFMAVLIGILFVASAIFAAALLTFAVAYGFLVAAHFGLPAADRLEGRQTVEHEP